MPQRSSIQKAAQAVDQAATKESYLSLAALLDGNTRNPFARKKNPHGEALREAGELYQRLQYVAAYECLTPAHEKVVADMQRVLARNSDFEANKLVKEQQKPLAAAKETVQKLRAYAQQVIDQFDALLQDLESKRLVRDYIKKGGSASGSAPAAEATKTSLSSSNETRVESKSGAPLEVTIGDRRYRKFPYAPPAKGALYSVHDKTRSERVIRITDVSENGAQVEVEVVAEEKPSKRPTKLAVDSLVRQAEKGWCSLLVPVRERESARASQSASKSLSQDHKTPFPGPSPADGGGGLGIGTKSVASDATLRLDIQNFGRCCADIARANIKFDTQLIKDVGDGPFRAGNYEQSFLTFEQLAIGFTSAVASSRQAIAEGRRALVAEKGRLSGKEIEERKAAFIRSEQLINTAQREFSAILEGLRMYLRAQQD